VITPPSEVLLVDATTAFAAGAFVEPGGGNSSTRCTSSEVAGAIGAADGSLAIVPGKISVCPML